MVDFRYVMLIHIVAADLSKGMIMTERKYKLKSVPECANPDGFEVLSRTYQEIAKEREELASVIKMLESRKKKLDLVIKDYLKNNNELCVVGVLYTISHAKKIEYLYNETIDFLSESIDIPKDVIITRLSKIDNLELDKMMKKMAPETADKILVGLDKYAKKTYTQRLISKRIKE
jgi:hypothetical protein